MVEKTKAGSVMVVKFQEHVSWSGSGHDSTQNQGTGESGSSGNGNGQAEETKEHKLLTQYNKLVAEGKGGTTQAQNLGRYLGRVEQKKQAEGESLYGDVYGPELHKPSLSSEDIVNQLAALEASDPKYLKSWEGQKFIEDYIAAGEKMETPYTFTKEEIMASDAWRDRFGMPSIVAMGYREEDPIMDSSGQYIYSGLGKSMMDQFEGSVAGTQLFGGDIEAYQQSKDAYWSDRAVQEERDRTLPGTYGGYGGGGGSGGGGGYYGDPRTGNPIDRYGNFYTPQANLQQAMVNVHGTPTVFKKRGGIVSLLRL